MLTDKDGMTMKTSNICLIGLLRTKTKHKKKKIELLKMLYLPPQPVYNMRKTERRKTY